MSATSLQAQPGAVMMMDLDGTICLGAGPARCYARELERRTGLTGVVAQLERFEADPDADPAFADCEDLYDVVAAVARDLGVEPADRDAAYLASRRDLADAQVFAPCGLKEFLTGLAASVTLVTNAPAEGLAELLKRLGVAGLFDDVVCSAGKPDGVAAQVEPVLARGQAIISVGDRWENDLAPVAALGGATAHVDTFGRGFGSATMVARTLPELYPALARWDAAMAAGSAGAQTAFATPARHPTGRPAGESRKP
ncbi:MAG: hypothetical protein LBD70_05920 [Bifidobacteriaceae bacterium]|jgi:FMN phosphatase YigB (HAD superfamily)|nr:hypothetical protein [Bifidobacteriaceae bacterium]